MKLTAVVLALSIATSAAAQGPSATPVPGPARPPAAPSSRGDLWQMLTPEQREQLWRSLTPEQRSDVWRGLQSEERREMRERLGPGELRGDGALWGGWRRSGRSDGAPGKSMMTPEERQQMRDQIREAHRLQRERLDADRARGAQ